MGWVSFQCLVSLFCLVYLDFQPIYPLQHSGRMQIHQVPATPESMSVVNQCSITQCPPNTGKVKSARPIALQSLRMMPKQHLTAAAKGTSPPKRRSRARKSKQPQIFRKGTPPPLPFTRLSFVYLHFYAAKDHLESLQFKGAKCKAPACPACLDYCHLAQLPVHSLMCPVTK